VALVEVDDCRDRESRGQDIKTAAGYPEGRLLEFVRILASVLPDPPYHVPDADAGRNLDERIQPEPEEREAFVFKAKKTDTKPSTIL